MPNYKDLAEAQAARFKHFMATATEAEFNEFQQWRISQGYAQPAFKGDLAPYSTGGKLVKPTDLTPEDVAAFAKQWRESAPFVNVVPDKTTLTWLDPEGVTADLKTYPITWDAGTQAYTAATLTDGDAVLVDAVNVYCFTGALRVQENGKRSRCRMLFELAEVVPVSGLHVAVDKMNTHYFETGRFEKRAFNAKNVRPATAPETLEYLNAKYKYQLKNS